MKLATSSMIKEIDAFCEKSLGIPTRTLMKKAGEAIERPRREPHRYPRRQGQQWR